MKIKKEINALNVRKRTLNDLIKKLQKSYFGSKTMSETEYRVKLEKFKNMIRDVDRQIPLLNEELVKLKKDKSIKKNVGTGDRVTLVKSSRKKSGISKSKTHPNKRKITKRKITKKKTKRR